MNEAAFKLLSICYLTLFNLPLNRLFFDAYLVPRIAHWPFQVFNTLLLVSVLQEYIFPVISPVDYKILCFCMFKCNGRAISIALLVLGGSWQGWGRSGRESFKG